jgi:signal transduction histidine kinase
MLRSVADKAVQQAEPTLENRRCEVGVSIAGLPPEFDCCSLAVPLIIADEVIGVLVVEREGHHTITKEDLDVLEPLGAQLAISVWNAGLFEKIRQQAIELEARVIERTNEIRQQKERTEAILGSVADAVIVFDLTGQVIMTNPVAKELYDRHDLDFDLTGRVRSLVAKTLHNEEDIPDCTEIIELGPVTLQAKAARVVEGDEVLGSVVVMRDISVLKELDRMKDQFVSNVSHELRTPLANLKLYLSLLQQGRPERRASDREEMEREVHRLERLIGDLLQLSRLQSEHRAERPQVRQPVDIEEMIMSVIHNNTAWAESEKKLLVYDRRAPALPRVHGDPDQLVRALTNLIANAINYTPKGGRITVRSLVEASQQGETESVIIEVIDTGIGIHPEDLPMIFDRFYRGSNVEPNIPGTGLGLAIIKEIVELHGGAITVESQVGQGSTFRVALPAMKTRH